jgi:serine/threonine-protein kinase RsbW
LRAIELWENSGGRSVATGGGGEGLSSRAGDLRLVIPSTLDAVEKFCAEFEIWRDGACAGVDAFGAELLLREALTNAVIHGCSGDPLKLICCVLRARRDRLLISIRDEGAGFDWRAAWDRQAEPTDEHGRGIEIFRRYAESVRFNSRGNAVTLIKRFQKVNDI